jgi:PEP-CTERM motif-containing protein
MKAIILCLSLIVLSVSARAGVIFDNGAPRYDGSFGSDFDIPIQSVDDFWVLPGANTITDVHWWGHYDRNEPLPALDDWTIRIFANSDPDIYAEINWLHEFAIGDVGRSLTATVGELEFYEFSAFIPALTLAPNTLYWLSIVANTANENTDFYWSTSIAGQGGQAEQRISDGVDWFNAGSSQLAFRLTNDNVVPLPSTLALFALGLLGLTVRRRAA